MEASDDSRLLAIDNLSPEREQALAAARQVYLDAGGKLDAYERPFLLRFLYSHKSDLKKCSEQLEAAAEWRRHNGLDEIRAKNIADTTIPVTEMPHGFRFLKMLPMMPRVHEATVEGDYVSCSQPGAIQSEAILKVAEVPAAKAEMRAVFFEFNKWTLERNLLWADQFSVQRGHLVRWVLVQDCDGMTPAAALDQNLQSALAQDLTRPLMDRFYPYLQKMWVTVNAPWIVNGFWKATAWMFSKELQRRVKIYGAGSESLAAMSALLGGNAHVPQFLGGGLATADDAVRVRIGLDRLSAAQLAEVCASPKYAAFLRIKKRRIVRGWLSPEHALLGSGGLQYSS